MTKVGLVAIVLCRFAETAAIWSTDAAEEIVCANVTLDGVGLIVRVEICLKLEYVQDVVCVPRVNASVMHH